MGREVLDDTDVGDARRERALTAGGHLVDRAEVAVLQPGAQRLQRRVVALDVADGTDEAARGEGVGEAGGRSDVGCERLLDDGVHAGLGQGEPDLLVVRRRHGDHAVVDALGDEPLDARVQRASAGDAVRVTRGVGDGDERDAVERAENPGVVAPHHAETDEAGAQRHQAPAFATALTVSTIFSRSSADSAGCTGSDSACCAATSVCSRSSPGARCSSDGRRWLGIG